jgi:hypothetical protein
VLSRLPPFSQVPPLSASTQGQHSGSDRSELNQHMHALSMSCAKHPISAFRGIATETSPQGSKRRCP